MQKRQIAAMAMMAGSFIRLIFWVTAPVTGDATFHYTIMEYMAETWTVPVFEHVTGPNPYWYPPLYHIAGAFLETATGVAELAPLLFGLIGLLAFNAFAKKHYPAEASAATTMLCFLPFHVYYSGIGYMATFLFLLSVACYNSYLNWQWGGERKQLLLCAAFCALSASTHYHGFIPLLAIGAHMALKRPKAAATFFIVGLALASPWYARNYEVFGNPIWPKMGAGDLPGDRTAHSIAPTVWSLASPTKAAGLFFDFWVGAPNSGDDMARNFEVARGRIPGAELLALGWLAAVFLGTALAAYGARTWTRKELGLPVIIAAFCLGPYLGNNLARMWVALIPFIVLAMGAGYERMRWRWKGAVAAICIIALLGASYAYAYTYRQIRGEHIPFFEMMKSGIEEGENVVMPFNSADCVYYTGLRCLRVGSAGGIPEPEEGQVQEVLKEYGIDHVCCSSLAYDGFGEADRRICESFGDVEPEISYDRGRVWGRCWKLD